MERVVDQTGWLQAALEIATDLVADLDASRVHETLDLLAKPLVNQRLAQLNPRRQAEEISALLFGLAGYRGNREYYEDPANSLIDSVLRRRTGIPITLALVYCEVAKRAGVKALGVGFPGHFLVKVVDTVHAAGVDRSVLIDPFNNGQVVDSEELVRLAVTVNGSPDIDEGWLEPSSVRDIRRRMLNNLRLHYAQRRELGSALLVLHRLCQSEPDGPTGYRERGLLHRQLRAPHAAIDDLERYLELAPRASDAQNVSEVIDALRLQVNQHPRHSVN